MAKSTGAAATASPHQAPRPMRRTGVVVASLVAAVAVLALVAWGIAAASSARALIGQPVEHSGGTFTVLAAWTMDDPMRLMHPDDPDKFAASGMQMMSAMMSDPLPEGMKRVSIELELIAGDSLMTFPEGDVALTADGVAYGVYSSMLSDGELRTGLMLSAVAVFEVPVETGVAEFRLGPGSTPVAVDVAGSPGGGHVDHGTEEE